jgi:hypothetical protein
VAVQVALALERTAPPYTQLLSRELFEEVPNDD